MRRQIDRLQKKGLDKSEIVARLTGTRDGAGGARKLGIGTLDYIGFSDRFIKETRPDQWKARGGLSTGGSVRKPPKAPGTPGQPAEDDGGWGDEYEDDWSRYDQAAADSLAALFDTYGLGSLAGLVADMMKNGMSEAAIVAQLRETPEYKQRFPGMAALRQNGYNAISEAEYLQLEDSYHQALQTAGLPAGFYDSPQDFVKFMSNGVDPSEVKQRATAAVELANQVDPSQRELLGSMYGVNTGDLAAYFLDPKKAMPILQKQLGTVGIANAARKAGVEADFNNRARFEALVDNGIGVEQAAQGYSQIATEMDPLKNLSQIWGQGDWGLGQAEQATFYGNAQAKRKRKGLIDTERAAFSGRSGFDSRVSGRGSSAGSF
jgi:hypothetical protein